MSTAAPKQARPYKGEELELTVESIAQGGRGIARRDDGFVVFVTGGLPGDRVRARVGKSKKGYAEASSIELIEPSPDRIADTCVHDGEPCPGAPWQGLPYERQLELKAEQVDEALRRLGGLDGFETEPIVPASSEWRYRNKLEYSFGDADGETRPGLPSPRRLAPRRRRRRLPPRLRAQQRGPQRGPRMGARERPSAPRVHGRARRPAPPRRPRGHPHRPSADPPRHRTRRVPPPARRPPHHHRRPVRRHRRPHRRPRRGVPRGGARRPSLPHLPPRLLSDQHRDGRDALRHRRRLRRPHRRARTLWDLYCGIGTIGLSLAGRAKSVWGMESVPEAVADAERNAIRNGINNTHFHRGRCARGRPPAHRAGGQPGRRDHRPAPRRPLKKVVRRLIEAEAPRIVYVSCNPTTLAPNAAQLVEAGYDLKRIRPVDMFPQTPHVECVALLERAG